MLSSPAMLTRASPQSFDPSGPSTIPLVLGEASAPTAFQCLPGEDLPPHVLDGLVGPWQQAVGRFAKGIVDEELVGEWRKGAPA